MFAIILFGNIMLKFILILAIILFGSCETIFFTCNNTCLILVNVHENHEQVYNSFIENEYFVRIMK